MVEGGERALLDRMNLRNESKMDDDEKKSLRRAIKVSGMWIVMEIGF